MAETKKFPRWAKILCIVLAIIIGLCAIFTSVLFGVWGNEISTVSSFTHLRDRNDERDEGSVYSMHLKGGYYLDKFREQGGASSDTELIGFITQISPKG